MPRRCNCSGQCGPPPSQTEETGAGVSRREFIALAGIGTAGALLTLTPEQARARSEADLAAWKKGLLQPAAPRRYRSDTHTDARMHLGGIGTGNFEIGADGQFTTWQLFNTLRDGYVPLFFAVRAGENAKMLQTKGGPEGIPRIASIEMTGEYPMAMLRFVDPELPVQLELTAFTPFAPLDTEFSSMPLACFTFKIHNPTHMEQSVALGAFMQNPVGYDAMGVPISFNSVGFNSVAARWNRDHPNFGGNYNELTQDAGTTALAMKAQPAAAPTIEGPLAIRTNLPVHAFNTPFEQLPDGLRVLGLPTGADDRPAADTAEMVWLEDAPADLAPATLRAAVQVARRGGTLVFSGGSQPLLQQYAQVTGGKPLDQSALRPDILFEDFESGYGNWTVTGEAFGTAPARGTLAGQQQVTGFLGHGLVNSFQNGDDTTGRMVSKPFKIERNFIRFLIGGGSQPTTQLRLVIGAKTVRAASGQNDERLRPAFWDVKEFQGQEAHLEIVDEQKGGWGHINVDQIDFGDLPAGLETLTLLDEILPLRFTAVRSMEEPANRRRVVEFENQALRPDAAEQRLTGGQRLFARTVGTGRVVVLPAPLLVPEQAELIGARRVAYARLAELAELKLTMPAGSPALAPGLGDLALAVAGKSATASLAFDDWAAAFRSFAHEGFQPVRAEQSPPTPAGQTCNGALATDVVVPAGKSSEVTFVLAWRYPNKYAADGSNMGCHYATTVPDARSAALQASRQAAALRDRTERFRSACYDSSLPYWMLDCITSQVSTIRHVGVVFRIANGDVYGWEGSNGCCDPTCTHVWGYVANLARVFPEMEREMRRIDFKHQQLPNGGVNNRTAVPSPPHPTGERPFTDGHCSCILKAYREALNTTDDRWLRDYWPNVRQAVEYLMARDAATSGGAPNGLLEDDQWNTYDEALHGVTSFIGTYYLAALRAGEEWAKRVDDAAFAERCRTVFLAGQKNLIDRCWNGEYFQQNLPGYEMMGGEVGPGCMADQLIGQWWAHQLGLGYLLPEDKVKTALRSVFKYNWMPDLTNWKHSPRAFAGAGDRGLIICTWPHGGRPERVMLYSDEVWTGIEYQVAAHLIYEGLIEEGFAVVKGARDRYDGVPRAPIPRNPWNEIECGGHYARAGSSWSLLLAMSGWLYDGVKGELTFRPRHDQNGFKGLFTGPEGWGIASQTRKGSAHSSEIRVVEGNLRVSRVHLEAAKPPRSVRVTAAGKPVPATLRSGEGGSVTVELAAPLMVPHGDSLQIVLS